MRGRDSKQAAETVSNPLARRFQSDSEPDTIDLADPGRFHAPGAQAEPETSSADTGTTHSPETPVVVKPLHEVLTIDTVTGKFYVHPAGDGLTVLRGGQVVTSATQLRPGDRIQIGDAEFEFLPR